MDDLDSLYEQTSKNMRFIYGLYVKYLLGSFLGAAVLWGYMGKRINDLVSGENGHPQELSLQLISNDITMKILVFAIPFICISWAAGWAYLNFELWAHRHYLGYIEKRQQANKDSPLIMLHGQLFAKDLYSERPIRWLNLKSHSMLDILVSIFPLSIGLFSLILSSALVWFSFCDALGVLWAIGYGIVVSSLYASVFVLKVHMSNSIKRSLDV
jgi:hypothetical protein